MYTYMENKEKKVFIMDTGMVILDVYTEKKNFLIQILVEPCYIYIQIKRNKHRKENKGHRQDK
jgi:hypothetical protein